jgi:hypothetical protein
MPQPFNSRLLMAGFRSYMFHYDGRRWFTCNSWELTMNWESTDEHPLGTIVPMAVTQSVTFELTVSELTIDDNVPASMLRGIQDPSFPYVPSYRFIAEIVRPDGVRGSYVLDDCVPSGSTPLAQATPGETMTREYTFRVNNPPDMSGMLGDLDANLGRQLVA